MRYIGLGALLGLWVSLTAGTLDPELKAEMDRVGPDGYVQAIVVMKDQADVSLAKAMTKKAYGDYVKDLARRTQEPLLAFLEPLKGQDVAWVKTYWVVNAFALRAKPWVISKIAEDPAVQRVEPDRIIPLDRAVPAGGGAEPDIISWGVTQINADDVWALGYTGEGVIVGSIDTGVDANHPALAPHFSGYWLDAIAGNPNPYDDLQHGTHTTGTMVGGDGPGPFDPDIGVAPGAQFAMCKAFTSGGGPTSSIMQCFNWYFSLVTDSGVNIRAVNNSWGSSATTSTTFWNAVLNWRAVGIIPVFSIGNDGPGSGTAGTPGNFPTVIGVGATNSADIVASFSSRGPAPNQPPWNDPQYWPTPDWNFIKPDIVAPGVSIYSSIPGGGYSSTFWSGTSMSAPHVTGTIALLYSKNPALTFEQVYEILTTTAYQPAGGGPYPNNTYGWGRVDALAAIMNTPTLDEPFILLLEVSALDSGGDGQLDPGESADIVVTLTNLSDTVAQGLTGTLTTTSPYVTITDGTTTFGDVALGDTVDNSADPFTIQIDPGAPSGADVEFTLELSANGGAYTAQRYFTLTIGVPRLDWVTVTAGNAALTVTDIGALGFMGSDQAQGDGFIFPYPGQNRLYYGSLAVGNSASYVVDAWYESGGSDDRDFEPATSPDGRIIPIEPPILGDINYWAAYTDSGFTTPQGLYVEQLAMADTSHPDYADFIVVKHTLFNIGSNPLTGLYVAYFMDFDSPGNSFQSDQGGTDQATRLAYMYNLGYYFGVALLEPDSVANLSIIHNPTYIYPNQGMPDPIQWQFMNGTLSFPSSSQPDDHSVVVSAGPFDLNPGDSVAVYFAVVGGINLADIIANVQAAQQFITGVMVSEEPPVAPLPFALQAVAPNPTHGPATITFTLPTRSLVTLTVYDAAGKRVRTLYRDVMNAGRHTLTWDGRDQEGQPLPSGLYFIRLQSPTYGSRTTSVLRIR